MALVFQASYILAAGGERAIEQLNTVTNNIANVNTPGFKRLIEEEMSQHVPNGGDAYNLLIFPRFKKTHIVLEQGNLMKTDSPLDLALKGEGFFAVKVGNSEVYTRNGHFFINGDGRLVDSKGNPVLDIGGSEIVLEEGVPITITRDGVLFQRSRKVAVLKIVNFPSVRPLGDSYYAGVGTPSATDATVLQGFLESSNVNPVKEMVELIKTQRRFEMYGNLLKALDRLNLKSNEIARV